MFVKYINETQIEQAPKTNGAIFNYHLNEAALRADGYKPLTLAETPDGMTQPEIRYREEMDMVLQFYIDTYVAPEVPEPTYAELRAAEYPSIAGQLDMIYWDGVNGTTTWADTIAAVKTKYPKPIHSAGGCESDEAFVNNAVSTDSKQVLSTLQSEVTHGD